MRCAFESLLLWIVWYFCCVGFVYKLFADHFKKLITVFPLFTLQAEIQTVLSTGASPDRIVYANPCKQSNYIRHAKQVGVDLMTFDNEYELHKIKRCFDSARLVLRQFKY